MWISFSRNCGAVTGGGGEQNITILFDLNWSLSRLSKADFSSVFPSFEVTE